MRPGALRWLLAVSATFLGSFVWFLLLGPTMRLQNEFLTSLSASPPPLSLTTQVAARVALGSFLSLSIPCVILALCGWRWRWVLAPAALAGVLGPSLTFPFVARPFLRPSPPVWEAVQPLGILLGLVTAVLPAILLVGRRQADATLTVSLGKKWLRHVPVAAILLALVAWQGHTNPVRFMDLGGIEWYGAVVACFLAAFLLTVAAPRLWWVSAVFVVCYSQALRMTFPATLVLGTSAWSASISSVVECWPLAVAAGLGVWVARANRPPRSSEVVS